MGFSMLQLIGVVGVTSSWMGDRFSHKAMFPVFMQYIFRPTDKITTILSLRYHDKVAKKKRTENGGKYQQTRCVTFYTSLGYIWNPRPRKNRLLNVRPLAHRTKSKYILFFPALSCIACYIVYILGSVAIS